MSDLSLRKSDLLVGISQCFSLQNEVQFSLKLRGLSAESALVLILYRWIQQLVDPADISYLTQLTLTVNDISHGVVVSRICAGDDRISVAKNRMDHQ